MNKVILEKKIKTKPIIGITLDNENPGHYSKFPWYAIRANYLHTIEKLNGIPFPLFHSMNNVNDILNIIDGIIITGGNFDIEPSLYGHLNQNSRNKKNLRTNFEIELFNKSFLKKIPILGICGGEQVINVALGGTLIQDIKSLKKKTLEHEQLNPRDETSHKVFIEQKSFLQKIIKKKIINVNSAHHQSVDKLGRNLICSGKSSDGIIESIESNKHKWCIGVQWHPEFLITEEDNLLFQSFIKNTEL